MCIRDRVDPRTLGLDNRKVFSWTCVTGNHERNISISSAIQGKRMGKECRSCSGYSCIAGVNDAFTLFPELRERLDRQLNGGIDLRNIHPGNRDIVLSWSCSKNHTWRRPFAEELKSKGCGKCSVIEVWEGHTDLLSQFPNVASEIAYDLNDNLDGFVQLPASQIHKNSGSDSWWRCARHGHTWRTKIEKRTREGTGCPYCSDRRVWPGFNDLWTKRPDLVSEIDFDKHPGLNPEALLWVSHMIINWVCSENHRWPTQLHLRTSISSRRPTGCPTCSVSGFKPEEPGLIYFIENKELFSFKVGITNVGTQRLSSWQFNGWNLLKTFEFEKGSEARFVEGRFHYWRRNVLQQQDFLSKEDVGRMGGWTETFNNEAVSSAEVLSRLQEIIDTRAAVSSKVEIPKISSD
jgi:hypothetical protein